MLSPALQVRSSSRRGDRSAIAATVFLLLAGACGDGTTTEEQVQSGSDTPSSSGARDPAESPVTTAEVASTQYALLERSDWHLQEALDYRAGLGPLGEIEPDLDWYAQYEGPRIDHDDDSWTIPTAKLAGYTAGLEALRSQLPGFEFGSEDVGGRPALVAAAANRNPAVVILELQADYSVSILSYDDVVDLRYLAAGLVLVDEQQWVTNGGQMLDCVPFEPGCAPSG